MENFGAVHDLPSISVVPGLHLPDPVAAASGNLIAASTLYLCCPTLILPARAVRIYAHVVLATPHCGDTRCILFALFACELIA